MEGRICRDLTGLLIGLALACVLAAPGTAAAAEPIESFTVTPTSSQAGGHPDVEVSFALEEPGGPASSARLEAPPGQLIVPTFTPDCLASEFATASCTPATQVGSVTVRGAHEMNDDFLFGTAAVYNLQTAAGEYGRIGFVIPTIDEPIVAPLTLRSENAYRQRIFVEGLPEDAPLRSMKVHVWGLPANPSHDAERLPEGTMGCPGLEALTCKSPVVSPSSEHPFTTYPTFCFGSPSWSLDVRTFDDPGTPSTSSASVPKPEGCNQLAFHPSTELSLGTTVTDSPTSMDLTLNDPISLTPTSPMDPPLRSVATGLPGIVTIDQAKLAAIPACTPQQAKLGAAGPATCPDASKLGTIEIEGPLLSGSVKGALYYGGSIGGGGAAVILAASGDGLDFKEALFLEPSGAPGSLFLETGVLPQLPISKIQMSFGAGGGSSVLRTARRCGTPKARIIILSWDNAIAPAFTLNPVNLERPGGEPCAEEAATIHVAAAPSSLPADGASTATVTATVSDKSAVPVIGDEIAFEASDPGVEIGPVVDNEDGTYAAALRASTTPGPVTITVTDRAVEPLLKGEGEIVLAPLPRPTPPGSGPPPVTSPRTTIVKHPPGKGRKRRATFAFTADLPGSTFSCKLDAKPYRRCESPLKLSGLKPGRHTFRVFATGPSGLAGAPATFHFKVLKRPV